jgi:uncharacterized membrane protein YfcA
LILAASIGLIGGFASGLFGIGGGSIRIPLLYLAGFTLISAYGMNLLALPLTTLTGAVSHKHNINLRIGSLMVVGGSMGTVLGTLVAFSIAVSAVLISLIFVIASIIAVVAMNMNSIAPRTSNSLKPTSLKLVSGTFVCNTLTGMRGGSEGSLFVPLLRALNIDMHKAIATALFSAVFTSIVGVLLYWNTGQLLFVEGVVLLIGSSVGAKLGSMLSIKANSQSLKVGLSLLIIVLAAITVMKAVFF